MGYAEPVRFNSDLEPEPSAGAKASSALLGSRPPRLCPSPSLPMRLSLLIFSLLALTQAREKYLLLAIAPSRSGMERKAQEQDQAAFKVRPLCGSRRIKGALCGFGKEIQTMNFNIYNY